MMIVLGKCRTYLVLNNVLRNRFQFELTPELCSVPRKVMMISSSAHYILTASCSSDGSPDDALYFDSALNFFGNLTSASDLLSSERKTDLKFCPLLQTHGFHWSRPCHAIIRVSLGAGTGTVFQCLFG